MNRRVLRVTFEPDALAQGVLDDLNAALARSVVQYGGPEAAAHKLRDTPGLALSIYDAEGRIVGAMELVDEAAPHADADELRRCTRYYEQGPRPEGEHAEGD